jgi:hypothetical protein
MAQMQLEDPIFSEILWKLTPASMAVRLSQGRFKTWNFVQLLSRKLVDVAMGRCPRLIVCMPPRSGKSELVSKWFCTWMLENFQARKIILASYEADFAAKWGMRVRDIIQENQDSLTVRLSSKNPAMHHFETSEGGSMSCVGVGGAITGKGCNVLIVDDFVKNAEESNSLTMREKTYDWWTSTARTRIEPFMDRNTGERIQPGVILIATRWHEDDLIGRLINPLFTNDTGEREQWELFVFPACADPEVERYYRQFGLKVNDLRTEAMSGKANDARVKSIREQIAETDKPEWRDILGRKFGEALCPERYNEKDFALFKSTSLRDWHALFQQTPGNEADDGNVYHCFDERTHCKPLNRDEAMQLFVSLDFNVNPGSIVIGQYDRGVGYRLMNRCEILEEIVIPNSNTMDMMARLLLELKKYQWGYTLEVEVYGDAAGTQRSSQSQKSNWQIVAEYFAMDTSIHYRFLRKKANPMIVDRVNAVNTMLKSADGTVRLYVDDVKCPELVKDFKKVKWQTDSAGSSSGLLDKSDAKRTHISDALGYALEYLFALKGRAGGRKGVLQ